MAGALGTDPCEGRLMELGFQSSLGDLRAASQYVQGGY